MNVVTGGKWAAVFVALFGFIALGVYTVPSNDGMSGLTLLIFAWPWIFFGVRGATTVTGLLVYVALNALIIFVLGAAFGGAGLGDKRT